MVAFELDHMLALVRRLDDAGHDAGVQERWHGYSDCIRSGDAPWLIAQFKALAIHIKRTTRILLRPCPEDTGAERLRQSFWLAIWLYRTATRRRVDLPELVFALRDIEVFANALARGVTRDVAADEADEVVTGVARVTETAGRRARWETCARDAWASEPELERNATATARAIVDRLRAEGDPNPGSVNTIRRFLAQVER